MKHSGLVIIALGFVLLFALATAAFAQSTGDGTNNSSIVPSLINYSSILKDSTGKTLTSITGVTFLIYADEQGGAPLWLETQNVTPGRQGSYTVQLGATSASGLPEDLFQSGEARWLAIQISGEAEQPRVQLVAVPYAMKAADAQTLGGLPASAFMQVPPGGSNNSAAAGATASGGGTTNGVIRNGSSDVTTTGGTVNAIPLFSTATNIQNSILTQSGTSAVSASGNLSAKGELAAGGTAGGHTANGTVEVDAGNTNNGTYSPGLNFGGGGEAIASNRAGTVNKDGIDFYTKDARRMSLTNSGLLGIGTATPTSPLHVVSNSTNVPNIYAPNGGVNGVAIEGSATATNGTGFGLEGTTVSGDFGSYGVYGVADNAGTSLAIGVYGTSLGSAGTGVFGQYGLVESAVGFYYEGLAEAGVWGDAGPLQNAVLPVGVLGTADSAIAGSFINNSPEGNDTLGALSENSATGPFAAFNNSGSSVLGCSIDATGDLNCSGTVNGVVAVEGGARQVAVSAIASPKNWFEDFGSGRLLNGVAVITLDSAFIQTVNTEKEYQVFLTPYGDCKGLYVTNRTANSFEVHELGGGTASLSFGYRITALRKNYENVRFADLTADVQKHREMVARMKARKGSGQSHEPQRTGSIAVSK